MTACRASFCSFQQAMHIRAVEQPPGVPSQTLEGSCCPRMGAVVRLGAGGRWGRAPGGGCVVLSMHMVERSTELQF